MRTTKGIAKEVHGCYKKTSVLKPRKFDRHGSTIVYWHSHACNCRKFFSTFLTLLGKRKFYLEEFFIIWESIWSNIQCIWSLSQLRWWGPNTNLKGDRLVIRDIFTFASFIPSWVKQTLELKASKKKGWNSGLFRTLIPPLVVVSMWAKSLTRNATRYVLILTDSWKWSANKSSPTFTWKQRSKLLEESEGIYILLVSM